MKKILFFGALLLFGLGAWAQTNMVDVTSTYLENAEFDDEGSTQINAGLCTYDKDVSSNGADGSSLYPVTGWTVGTTGDGKAGGWYKFNTKAFLGGKAYTVPAANSSGNEEGGALGIAGCWGGDAYYTQNLKTALPAGAYTIEIMGYNAGTATAFGTQTFGIKESNGTTHYVTTTWMVESWNKVTLSFELSEATEGTFYLGATGIAGGSAASAKVFIDYVKIYKVPTLQDMMDQATEESPSDVTSFYLKDAPVTGTSAWAYGSVNSGEQYTGAPDKTYLDTYNKTLNQYQVVTLKPGKYTLKAATRADKTISVANIYANVSGGSNNSTNITAVGNTDGELGNGWGWTTVDFLVMEEAEVTIGFYSECSNSKWAGADDFSLYYDRAINDGDKVAVAKEELKTALAAVSKIDASAIGTDAFQYAEEAANDYNKAIDDAQSLYESESATLDEVNEKVTAVKALSLPALNVPDATQAYRIILKDNSWTYDNCAITSKANDRTDAGLYNLQYLAQNDNYAQAFFFDQTETGYKIRFTDAEGNNRYICTGSIYGGNNSQIRTTTSVDEALVVEVQRNGSYLLLKNTAANGYIGSQDAGVYTTNHNNFVVEKTTAQNAITREVGEGRYATIVLPYLAEATAYTATLEGDMVVLNEVQQLEANKAYILGKGKYEFSGVNIAFKEPASEGVLTGVYTSTKVPAGNYVLQTLDDVQKFYIVAEGSEPTLSANKAYLTNSSASVKELSIGTSETTAIRTVEALLQGSAPIYDLNGRRRSSLQKGINIVNGNKILVK